MQQNSMAFLCNTRLLSVILAVAMLFANYDYALADGATATGGNTGSIFFPSALSGCMLVYLIYLEARDVLFYYKNGWNFNEDNIYSNSTFNGDSANEDDAESNFQRVAFGRPFSIAIFLLILLGLLLSR